MPRYIATVTVEGKQYKAKATADNPASAHQKICASAASAFPGKQITVGYATEIAEESKYEFSKAAFDFIEKNTKMKVNMKLRDIKAGSYFRLPNGDVMVKGFDIEDRTPFNGTPGLHARCFFVIKPISGHTPTGNEHFWVSENLDVDPLTMQN